LRRLSPDPLYLSHGEIHFALWMVRQGRVIEPEIQRSFTTVGGYPGGSILSSRGSTRPVRRAFARATRLSTIFFNTTAALIADHPGAPRLRRFNAHTERGVRMEKAPNLTLDIEAA
jgi:hypothetical protein